MLGNLFYHPISDSSELGTNLDALLCLKCSGPILPEDPIEFNSSVKCFKCAEIYDKDQIRQSESDFLQEIDECDKKDPKAMETLLDKCQSSLYPTHYLIIALKRHLIYAYGRIPGYFLNELSEESIRRKHSYCQEILTIYEVIAPGFTKERGLTIFELCSVNLFLLKQSLGSPEEKKRNIQVLKEITKCLEEVINCLQYEKTCSFEDMVCKAAQREITQCKQLLEVIELLL